ncbi:probable carboxylesterase 2 [Diospyros lotus]|uniref:probable carboxylesterase 2 n=1 Tax=Diospyros lotus TaxID=55363 RepID=UPI00225C09DB|nr:probable carboxylesterase 2 [Diospyros lotus]
MAAPTAQVAYDLSPFLRVYKDGKVERLMGTEIVPPSADDHEGVHYKDVVIQAETGVSARLYKPKTTDPSGKLPLLLYFHGGAFFVQTAFSPTYHNFLTSLAGEAKVLVVSVDYRRAPEHPLPAAYDDSWAAVKWAAAGGDPWLRDYANLERLFFAGDSAGANISHNLAMRVGSDGLEGGKLVGIILMHPYFWGKDPIGNEAELVEVRATLERFWALACPTSAGTDDPWINPVADRNLGGLGCREVMVCVAERDPLRERGWLYAKALRKSGWKGRVEMVESEGEGHVFHLDYPNSEKTMALLRRVADFCNQGNADHDGCTMAGCTT